MDSWELSGAQTVVNTHPILEIIWQIVSEFAGGGFFKDGGSMVLIKK